MLAFASGGRAGEPAVVPVAVDTDRLPQITLKANRAAPHDVLDALAATLHFKIDNRSALPNATRITGSFTGDPADVLRRAVLRGASYVIVYRDAAIARIILLSEGAGTAVAAVGGSSEDAKPMVRADTLSNPTASLPSLAPEGIARSQSTAPQKNPVAVLFDAQIAQQAAWAGVTSPVRAGPSVDFTGVGGDRAAIAAMTFAAQQNVQMLAHALSEICIGPKCPR